jgi:hypothetical protein
MLKFVNKKGQVVAEMKDNGQLNVLSEDAKLASLKEATKEDEEKEEGEE